MCTERWTILAAMNHIFIINVIKDDVERTLTRLQESDVDQMVQLF